MSLLQRFATAGKSHLRSLSVLQSAQPVAGSPSAVVSTRGLSTAREKLQSVMEAYRKKNYGQELPSRFAKEVTKAADLDGDGYISVSELEKLFENIGAKDALTQDEIDEVMGEMGSKDGPKGVSIEDVINYVKKSAKPGVS